MIVCRKALDCLVLNLRCTGESVTIVTVLITHKWTVENRGWQYCFDGGPWPDCQWTRKAFKTSVWNKGAGARYSVPVHPPSPLPLPSPYSPHCLACQHSHCPACLARLPWSEGLDWRLIFVQLVHHVGEGALTPWREWEEVINTGVRGAHSLSIPDNSISTWLILSHFHVLYKWGTEVVLVVWPADAHFTVMVEGQAVLQIEISIKCFRPVPFIDSYPIWKWSILVIMFMN